MRVPTLSNSPANDLREAIGREEGEKFSRKHAAHLKKQLIELGHLREVMQLM